MYNDRAYHRKDCLAEHFPTILTPAEAMDVLGVGKNTMYRLLDTGKLRGFRVGRSWKITSDALEDFIYAGPYH